LGHYNGRSLISYFANTGVTQKVGETIKKRLLPEEGHYMEGEFIMHNLIANTGVTKNECKSIRKSFLAGRLRSPQWRVNFLSCTSLLPILGSPKRRRVYQTEPFVRKIRVTMI
jgi:hypothetical protein